MLVEQVALCHLFEIMIYAWNKIMILSWPKTKQQMRNTCSRLRLSLTDLARRRCWRASSPEWPSPVSRRVPDWRRVVESTWMRVRTLSSPLWSSSLRWHRCRTRRAASSRTRNGPDTTCCSRYCTLLATHATIDIACYNRPRVVFSSMWISSICGPNCCDDFNASI